MHGTVCGGADRVVQRGGARRVLVANGSALTMHHQFGIALVHCRSFSTARSFDVA